MKWLIENRIEMYSTHNEGKPVVAERFIKKIKKQDLKAYDSSVKKYLF